MLPLRLLSLCLLLLPSASRAGLPVEVRPFGKLADGREAQLFVLANPSGFRAEITNLGGIIVRLLAPDRTGRLTDVVLGLSSAAEFEAKAAGFNAITGRYANRIAGGRFVLDGRTYTLATNSTSGGVPAHLHGGKIGFSRKLWSASPTNQEGAPAVRLRYRSPDGEEGYPGNLDVEVTYSVTPENALRIDYVATTDRPTPINLTNHAYFNLKGEGEGDVLEHVLTLDARRYTPVHASLIPTGEIAPVAGTPLDFTTPQRIGDRMGDNHPQIGYGRGYDHNFVFDSGGGRLARGGLVFEPSSGRVLELWTTEPGVQLYTANHLNGRLTGKSGRPYVKHAAFCLETQHFPDSPNQPDFPSTILRPGETFRSTTIFRFSTR
ncbi:MAG: galactose mutarotase [Verrucomicrobia bacterium]|nr:galactose mutarotase [Verrucomicrobiota bacterium]